MFCVVCPAAPEHRRVGFWVDTDHDSISIIIIFPFHLLDADLQHTFRGHDSLLTFSILEHLFWLPQASPLPDYGVFRFMRTPEGTSCLLVYTLIFFSGNSTGTKAN